MPKLSIITVNLNNIEGLRQTISSVVAQNLNGVEYLVIDGGSTDGSLEVVRQFEDRINYWVSESDSGIYNAMNKGIRRATGEYLLFLNSGDCLVDDQVFNDVIPMLKTADLIAGNILIGDQKKNYLVEFPDRMTAHYIVSKYIGHPSTFIKRSLFEKQLYSEELKIVSDWEFFRISPKKWLVIIISGEKFSESKYKERDIFNASQLRPESLNLCVERFGRSVG